MEIMKLIKTRSDQKKRIRTRRIDFNWFFKSLNVAIWCNLALSNSSSRMMLNQNQNL